MIRPIKWIEGAEPGELVTGVAASAVRQRLLVVAGYLGVSAKHSVAEVEHVHQLRVATRRAQAALDIFRDSFPKKRVRWFKKQLRRLRRAAGHVRNLDVLAARLKKTNKKRRSELDCVLLQVSAQRRKAKESLSKVHKQLKHKGFKKRSKQLAKSARWRGDKDEPSYGKVARIELRPLLDDFFSAATADLSDINALHRLRIRGKRLRYGMELVAGAFDKSFRKDLYPIFGVVQERIGIINDHATAKDYLASWASRTDESLNTELKRLTAFEDQNSDRTAGEFLEWWTAERLADLRRRFDAVLAAPTDQVDT